MTKRLLITFALVASITAAWSRPSAAEEALAGPNKADFLLGPSIGILDSTGTQFRLQFDYGYNVMPAPWGNLYINLPLGIGVGNNLLALLVEPGIEADFLLPVGIPLYLYPKAGIAFGLARFSGFADSISKFVFGFYFGGGVKYVLAGKWNLLFEPINIEILPVGGEFVPGRTSTLGAYNLMFGVGMNF